MRRRLEWVQALGLIAAAACGGQSTVHEVSNDGARGGGGGTGGASVSAGGTINGGGTGTSTGGTINPTHGGSGGTAAIGSGADGGKGGSRANGGKGGSSGTAGTAGDAGAPWIGGDGPGGSGGCSTESSAIVGKSFDVDLGNAGLDRPATVFHFDMGAEGVELLVGSEGQAFRGALMPNDGTFEVQPGLPIRDDGGYPWWSRPNGVSVEKLELCFHPGLDSAPSLDVNGVLLIVDNGDDYEDQYERTVAVNGAPFDTTAPGLPTRTTVDPLAPDVVPVSEPITLDASATLADGLDTPLESVLQADTVVAFQPSTVLPLGLDAAIVVTGHDFVANAVQGMSVLTTQPDPGVQPFDDFETALNVASYGNYAEPELVTGSSALEGTRSLSVPPGAVAVLHLRRPSASATHVKLDLQTVSVHVFEPLNVVVRAGVVGGSVVASKAISVPLSPYDDAAGAGGAPDTSNPVTAVDLELTESGDDVLVEIQSVYQELSDYEAAGAIVDRVRIE